MSTRETAGLFNQQPHQYGVNQVTNYVQFWRMSFTDANGLRHAMRYAIPVRRGSSTDECDDEQMARRTAREHFTVKTVLEASNAPLVRSDPDTYGTRWIDWGALGLTIQADGPVTRQKFDFMHWRDQIEEV